MLAAQVARAAVGEENLFLDEDTASLDPSEAYRAGAVVAEDLGLSAEAFYKHVVLEVSAYAGRDMCRHMAYRHER